MATANKPIPVLFRVHNGELAGYFPTLNWDRQGESITVYDGCHGGASREWLQKGRPASPDEYSSLLGEIQRLYSNDALGGVFPVVVLKRQPRMGCKKYHWE